MKRARGSLPEPRGVSEPAPVRTRGPSGTVTTLARPRPRRADAEAELADVRALARTCVNCPLYAQATQTVFGEGTASARVMLVGEQPGDREDLAGRPFVGPAGRLLDAALEQAGISRADVYVTNAVKHFKWEPRGKRRMHKKPNEREIAACSHWIEAELRIVRPTVVVCLGATAAMALIGREFRVTRDRGRFVESTIAPYVIATLHPAAVLRSRADREEAMRTLVSDLTRVAEVMGRAIDRGAARASHARRSEEPNDAERRSKREREAEKHGRSRRGNGGDRHRHRGVGAQ